MLIRWVTNNDISQWLELSKEYDQYITKNTSDLDLWYDGFPLYMDAKIKQYEAAIAIDRMSGKYLGIIAFSRGKNRITFFAICHTANFDKVSNGLFNVAMRQLDTHREITANIPISTETWILKEKSQFEKYGFTVISDDSYEQGVKVWSLLRKPSSERRGGSFHYNYLNYIEQSKKENCIPCLNLPMPDGQIDIAELEYSYATAEYPGQGRLFGKMHMLAKMHVDDFEEMPEIEMIGFMKEVQKVAKALHKVTGAVKINYEIHSNSGPHIHIHLFPRYLDDEFPSAPINYRVCEPAPYESYEEYLWFVNEMRKELDINQ